MKPQPPAEIRERRVIMHDFVPHHPRPPSVKRRGALAGWQMSGVFRQVSAPPSPYRSRTLCHLVHGYNFIENILSQRTRCSKRSGGQVPERSRVWLAARTDLSAATQPPDEPHDGHGIRIAQSDEQDYTGKDPPRQ